jgi:hypothetical protein
MFSGYSGWWIVVSPDIVRISNYTTSGLIEVVEWCRVNCGGEWRGSSIYPWMFSHEDDAVLFVSRWGGLLRPPDNI